jgi:hypothetical protein
MISLEFLAFAWARGRIYRAIESVGLRCAH